MTEAPYSGPEDKSSPDLTSAQATGVPARGRQITLLASALVLVLAVGAVLWPHDRSPGLQGKVLVLDPGGDGQRIDRVYEPLTAFLAETSNHAMQLVLSRTLAEFEVALGEGADFVLCPDGVALQLAEADFVSLVTGRRPAPVNLRPRGVLLRRNTALAHPEPWLTSPGRTVFGDSLSLAGTGVCREGGGSFSMDPQSPCTWGPDPYDHSPVLHAARLGAFDYVFARQWDAARFLAEGLLDAGDWTLEVVSVPVPDLVIMAKSDMALSIRLACRTGLADLGRSEIKDRPSAQQLLDGLHLMRLSGFNVLLEPDFDLVRGRFPGNWPPRAD